MGHDGACWGVLGGEGEGPRGVLTTYYLVVTLLSPDSSTPGTLGATNEEQEQEARRKRKRGLVVLSRS